MAERDFPVVFYDGERQINMRTVRVKSSLNFKSFQLCLSQRIGISPNQITVYLVDHRTSPEPRRKIPITSKSNFSLLVRETDCHILVVLKRTRRNRRAAAAAAEATAMSPEKFLLRRTELMRELQIQRENYAAAMNFPADSRLFSGLGAFPTIRESFSCRECEIARRQGKMAAFHHCICDAVVAGLRPTVAPIARPRKPAA